ncbi:hypothetical protein [Streptomyces sp. NPDC058989]|uniref:hypothetical protein n=1 Tax=Streptomyces sp. NPDC058989 TaxID=3346686 RepID=UPI0036BC877E
MATRRAAACAAENHPREPAHPAYGECRGQPRGEVEGFVRAGIPVDLDLPHEPRQPPASVDLTA